MKYDPDRLATLKVTKGDSFARSEGRRGIESMILGSDVKCWMHAAINVPWSSTTCSCHWKRWWNRKNPPTDTYSKWLLLALIKSNSECHNHNLYTNPLTLAIGQQGFLLTIKIMCNFAPLHVTSGSHEHRENYSCTRILPPRTELKVSRIIRSNKVSSLM